MDAKVFQFLGDAIESATMAFVQPAASSLMTSLQVLALTGVTLYISLTGYAISTGAVETPVKTFFKISLKIILITFFALTVDGYLGNVVPAFQGFEEGIAQALSNNAAPVSIYQVLDQSLGNGFEIVAQCFQKADEAGMNFGSVMSWVVAGVVVATGTVRAFRRCSCNCCKVFARRDVRVRTTFYLGSFVSRHSALFR